MNDIIKMTTGKLSIALEGEVMKAVQKVGIDVDKDKLLEALQLADTIVRCKECEWAEPNREGDYDCKCHIPTFRIKADDFCSHGERREP